MEEPHWRIEEWIALKMWLVLLTATAADRAGSPRRHKSFMVNVAQMCSTQESCENSWERISKKINTTLYENAFACTMRLMNTMQLSIAASSDRAR